MYADSYVMEGASEASPLLVITFHQDMMQMHALDIQVLKQHKSLQQAEQELAKKFQELLDKLERGKPCK